MSEMIERLARALCVAAGDKPDEKCGHRGIWAGAAYWEVYVPDARAAIEAMREPTDEMKAIEGVHWGYSCHVCGGLTEGWHAMIDAALNKVDA